MQDLEANIYTLEEHVEWLAADSAGIRHQIIQIEYCDGLDPLHVEGHGLCVVLSYLLCVPSAYVSAVCIVSRQLVAAGLILCVSFHI